ncbi:MAG: hypothetical protein SGILL_002133 [Bacillariaceae sp.]
MTETPRSCRRKSHDKTMSPKRRNTQEETQNPPSISSLSLAQNHPYQVQMTYKQDQPMQSSFWGACGSGAEVAVDEPIASNPLGLACGLIQEEADLLSRNKCQEPFDADDDDDDQPIIPQPVHASWIEAKQRQEQKLQQQVDLAQLMTGSNPGAEKSPQQTTPLSPMNNVTNQDSSLQPARPSQEDVRMMLDKVKQERGQNSSASKAMVSNMKSSKLPQSSKSSRTRQQPKPKTRLEPEEVRTAEAETKKMLVSSAVHMRGVSTGAKKRPPTPESKVAAPTRKKDSTNEKRPLQAMVLTRKKTNDETNLMKNLLPIKCVPDPNDISTKPAGTKSSPGLPLPNLWDEARRQRYDHLKDRVSQSVSPNVKLSASMQVETSSSAGSFFSSITGDESNRNPLQVKKSPHYDVPPFKSSRVHALSPDIALPVKDSKMGTKLRRGAHNPNFRDYARPDFWGINDRIEESRDTNEEAEQVSTDLFHRGSRDRIESLRGSPTREINQILGIPSLDSRQSSESLLEFRVRSIQSTPRAEKSEAPKFQIETNVINRTPNRWRGSPRILEKGSPGTPKLDQQTVRLLYAEHFAKMVQAHSQHHVDQILSENAVEKINNPGAQTGLSFVIRKRPMLKNEQESGDFDVVEAPPAHPDAIVLYEASILADRKTRDLKAHLFRFDSVFSDEVSDEEFYLRMGLPLIRLVVGGSLGTFILTGSHDSGKSYLMSKLEERAAVDIFAEEAGRAPKVAVQCLELNGSQCVDLLGPIGTSVRFVQVNGQFELRNALKATVSSPQELTEMLESAQKRSVTQNIVHRRNEGQSYLIHQVFVDTHHGDTGCLTFVECPHEDQILYSNSQIRCDATNQFSSLLEGITAKVSHRSYSAKCNLTKLLSQAFQSKTSETCIVGAVSPCSVDTDSSLSTLMSIKGVMKGIANEGRGKNRGQGASVIGDTSGIEAEKLTMPKQWTQTQVLDWMKKRNHLVPEVGRNLESTGKGDLSGRVVMRMTKMQLKSAFFEGMENGERRAEKMFIGLRAENDRAGRKRVKQRRAREKERRATHM